MVGVCVCVCGVGGGDPSYFGSSWVYKSKGLYFLCEQQSKLFLCPSWCLLGGGGKKSLQLSKLEQLLESQAFPDSFPRALLGCSESKKIIKALIYLYIFSVDIIDPTTAAS